MKSYRVERFANEPVKSEEDYRKAIKDYNWNEFDKNKFICSNCRLFKFN